LLTSFNMARGLKNWTFREVTKFLQDHGFYLSKIKGSHYFYIKKAEKECIVEVNFLTGGKSYPPLTMKTMIINSGISEQEWRNWICK